MIYKTTPATTLYLHHKSENNVTGYRYHDSDNDWIITREQDEQDVLDLDISELEEKKAFLQWKDVFWLRHVNTGRYLNSTLVGFQKRIEGSHDNDWIVEETTWLRQDLE